MRTFSKKITSLLAFVLMVFLLVGCAGDTYYTVEFDLNGAPGTVEAVKVKANEKIPKFDDPVWDGYEFGGWYKNESFLEENLWIFSIDIVEEDMTLYAKWGGHDPSVVIPSAPDLSVRHAEGAEGMVASASGYASEVGVQILKAGGNAFDAAVAVGFALNVTEPNASGIGGGGFMVGYNEETGEKFSYNYREFAPGLSDRSLYSGAGGTLELGDGPGSFGIPMMVDGMLTVLEDHGTMSLEEVMQPAIDLARYGFPVTESLAANIANNYSKIMRPTARAEALEVYTTDGITQVKEGDLLINKNLANTLEKIAREGREGFYKGDIARAIVSAVSKDGSVATMDDFEAAMGRTRGFQAQVPVTGTYKDVYEIISMYPPSSGGTTLLEIFNMLDIYDKQLEGGLKSLGHNTADYLHAVGSATSLAFGDRTRYIGDPNFEDVPVDVLISKDYAADRWANFDPTKAIIFAGPGSQYGDPFDPKYQDILPSKLLVDDDIVNRESGSTTHFSITDKFGNIVSATHTINYFFGNGYMPRGTGIHLNNIMSPLSINENSVNLIEGFKVGVSNMSPSIILKEGKPFMTIGSPGSMRITSAIVQTVLNIIEFEMGIQEAINSPRIHQYRNAQPEIESAMSQETINGLKDLGYFPDVRGGAAGIELYFGGVQGILILDNKFYGGADPRRDGKAVGY